MEKLFWVRADQEGKSWDERKKLAATALDSGADAVVVKKEEIEKVQKFGKIDAFSIDSVFYKEIKSKEDEREIAKAGKKNDYVVVNALDWRIIPLENLIAELQDERAKIIVEVKNAGDAKTALETMEVGSDGVLLNTTKYSEIKEVRKVIDEMSKETVELVPVKVTKVEPASMGDRVCVDTCSMFELGEGLLVGSQSNSMFLVHSETLESEYVAARPFRVNAGPVHAYVMVPGGKTRYLSELSAGDEVLAVNAKGETRSLVVGRAKIEKRPLMLVEAEHDGKEIRTLLQNAETINLVDKDGKAVSVTKLKPGDEVLAYREDVGRHFGVKIKETIEEK